MNHANTHPQPISPIPIAMPKRPLWAIVGLLLLSLSSCKVEFNPNAPWKDMPDVYCVIDPEEDTVWARVQRCYLGNDNLYSYASIKDSNYYASDELSVYLMAWKSVFEDGAMLPSNILVDKWQLDYTERDGKPEGAFPAGKQPLYYCVPGKRLKADTSCVFQLVVVKNKTGDTLASAYTTLVGFQEPTIRGRDTTEVVLVTPNSAIAQEFGFRVGCRGTIRWNTVPRGRLYQPIITFYYRKNGDTLSIDIPCSTVLNSYDYNILTRSISQERFLSIIKRRLEDNTDTLFFVNHVSISILTCNEDLNAYMTSHNNNLTVMGQEYQAYSNIEGGVGVFGSRRTHIRVRVPCDSIGTPSPGYLDYELNNLGVGFYGNF